MSNSTLIRLTFAVCAIILAVFAAFPFAGAESCELYPLTTVVVELNYEEDYFVCLDFNGNEWIAYEIEDTMIGDIMSLLMWDAGTETIYDDEIIEYKYNGYLPDDLLEFWMEH